MKGIVSRLILGGPCFIAPEDQTEDLYVHFNSLPRGSTKGSEVEFEIGVAPSGHGKKRPALNVKLISASSPAAATPKAEEKKPGTKTTHAQIVKPTKKRFEIHVGKIRPDKTYIINLLTRNAKLKPSKGTVQIYAGQKCRFAEAETPSGYGQFKTAKDGRLFTVLQLEEFDAYVTFKHEESGEEIKRFFLKEE